MSPDTSGTGRATGWVPLRSPLFRAFWIANIVSNVGTWMHEVGGAWMMTSLSSSPLLVALMETSISLPFFFLALPAGALADILDRRRLLLFTQCWMFMTAALLGFLSRLGLVTPGILLALTFTHGCGAAVNAPVWHAVVPEMVGRRELREAITLNSAGFNIARTVGPALGGVIIAASGPWAVFLLNAVSYLGVLLVFYRWRRPVQESIVPAERVMSAVRAGIRYVRHSPALHAVLLRSGSFIFFGSAFWALLPLYARVILKSGPEGYGVLLGFFGAGAVAGAAGLPWIKQKMSVDLLVFTAVTLFSLMLLALGLGSSYAVACGAVFLGGVAWLTLLSTFNAGAQVIVPSWVRGRVMAFYLLVFFGGLAAGSVLWGSVASHAGIPAAFLLSAAGAFAGAAATAGYRLRDSGDASLDPGQQRRKKQKKGPEAH